MMIIGCDYHPGFQQIGFVDTETGEFCERRLRHRVENCLTPPTLLEMAMFRQQPFPHTTNSIGVH